MRTAIFDLDGTLADTSVDLIAAANLALPEPVLDPAADAATAFRGGRAMLRLGLGRLGHAAGEAEIEPHFLRFLDYYADGIDRHTRLYDGVAAALDRLAGQGCLLGVCTNKPERLAETLLTRLGIRDRFRSMLGADTLPVRKPDARHVLESVARAGGDPRRAVLIGDSETDRSAARNAGVPCVLVTFGPAAMGVRELSPEAFLDHYDDLDRVLAAVLP